MRVRMEAWEKTYLGQAAFGGWSQGTRHPRSGMPRERLAPIGILGELHVVTDIGLTGMGLPSFGSNRSLLCLFDLYLCLEMGRGSNSERIITTVRRSSPEAR